MLLPLIGLIVLARIPAWDAAPIGGTLVVVDDTFLTVSGFHASTGKKSWTSRVIKEAKGRHTLHVSGGEVLAWFGETLSAIDPAGKVRALGTRGYNGVRWEDGGCWIDLSEGIAAQRCQCSFQVFDPRTNKDLGPRYQKTYMEFHEMDESGARPSRSAGCWGMSERLLGKAGTLALISAEDGQQRGKSKMRGDRITAAIDVTTGAEVWRLQQDAQFGGHSPDGKTCWFYGFTEAIIAVDCATGSKLWSGTALPAHGRHVVTYVPGAKRGAVLDLRAPSSAPAVAELYDARTGKSAWTAKLGADAFAWVRGTTPVLATSAHDATSLVILDPATGRAIATIAKPAGASFELDGRGGFVLADKEDLIAYDADGKETSRARLAATGITFGDSLLVARLDKELVVLERGTLRERGRLAGAFSVVHVEGALGTNRIAAYAYDGKTVGTVTLLSVR